jgi:SPW repeat
MIARFVAMVAGIWLMFAPAVLGYGDPAASNDRIFGPIGAAFAFVAVWEVVRPLRWATLPVGLWLILAPFVLGYSSAASVSTVVAGLAMVVTAPLGGKTRQMYGGGWRTLLPNEPVPDRRFGPNG